MILDGITPRQHAGGPGLKPQHVHALLKVAALFLLYSKKKLCISKTVGFRVAGLCSWSGGSKTALRSPRFSQSLIVRVARSSMKGSD